MTQPASEPIAPISRRAIAYVIDAVIASGLAIVLWGAVLVAAVLSGSELLTTVLIGGAVATLLLLGWFVVYTLMQAGAGSIGMRAQGLRLVSDADASPLGFGRTLVRNLVFGLACSIVVGYFTPLFDGSGRFQGWHDKVARSLMVDARAAAAVASAAPAATAAPAPPVAPVLASTPPVPPAPAPAAFTPAAFTPPATASSAPVQPAPAADGALIAFVPGFHHASPAQPAQPAEAELDATVQGFRSTAATPPPPVPAPIPAPVPAAVVSAPPLIPTPTDEHEVTRISVPGHRLVFTWDDGTRVTVSGRTVFGRNPTPEDGAQIVQLRDETLSLSKTHFEAAGEASGDG